ncbi:hypothetical protein [Microbacterium sp. R86528]|uniref:hypothetical protein n=1 Tax=Microbacterium sp. R86528 TaxID=3093864 RepID=UPI0037C6A389
MRTPAVAVASIALILALSACSPAATTDDFAPDTGRTPDTAPVITETPTPVPTAEVDEVDGEFGERVINDRGNLVKEVGQLAGVSEANDVLVARFAATDIVLDIECDQDWSESPQNGHFLGIHFNVETTPELADSDYPWVAMSAYDFLVFDSDGKRLNDPVGTSWACLDESSQLPSQIGPGQSVSGWIVLDVTDEEGAAVLTMGGSPTGWEWAY